MNVSKAHIFLVLLCWLLYQACSTSNQVVQSDVKLPPVGEFFENLSEFGIHASGTKNFVASPQLVKYEVINELFSDYANKDRYIYLPEGKKATLKDDGHFDWPEGTMLVKNFGYSKNQIGSDRLIETRLLIKETNAWKAVSYKWKDDQSSARRSKLGDIIPMNLLHNDADHKFEYIIPNKNQCKSCHNANEKIEPIGFKYANIDKTINVDGRQVSQIAFLQEKGIIDLTATIPPSTMVSYHDESADIQGRALAYLDINCGHCHRPNGPGNTSGLFLQYNETRSNHLGICKPPVAAGKGAGGLSFDIQPGDANASIIYYRMMTQDPGEMMPELGRSLVHAEGLTIIKKWIDSLSGDCD